MGWFTFKPYYSKYASFAEYQGFNLSECGPAALATILKKQRPDSAISRFACRARVKQPSWWTANSIVAAAKSFGVDMPLASYTMNHEAGIYLSSYFGFGHWVVAWRGEDNRVNVIDPKRGFYIMPEYKFRQTLKSNTYVYTGTRF